MDENIENSPMIEYLFKDSGLDKINLKMLSILRNNARIPLNELSKRCRISKQTALYRINKLLKENIITGFHTMIDFARLGYMSYYVFLQTRFIDDEHEFIKELSKITGCIIIMKSITQYSYSLKIITKHPESMIKELEHFFNTNKKTTSHFILQRLEKSNQQLIIDAKDKAILEELHMNCRQSALEISKKIRIGYDAVNNRIKRLIKDRVISGFMTMLNFDKYSFLDYSVVLKFADHKLESFPVFSETIAIDPLVLDAFKTLGEFNYMLEFIDNNYVHINNKINQIKSQFYELIKSTEIVPIQTHYFFKAEL